MKRMTGAKNTSCVNVDNQLLSWITGSITFAFTDPIRVQ